MHFDLDFWLTTKLDGFGLNMVIGVIAEWNNFDFLQFLGFGMEFSDEFFVLSLEKFSAQKFPPIIVPV